MVPEADVTAMEASRKASRGGTGEGIAVFARLRPIEGSDERGEIAIHQRFGKCKTIHLRNLEFSLDWIFDEHEAQEEVYAMVAHDRVMSVLEGYNATLLAYGQTVVPPLASPSQRLSHLSLPCLLRRSCL